MFDLKKIQNALQDFGLDGWLLYDFRGNNVLARRVLDLDGKEVSSRRFFYWIPVTGEPSKLVHRIESEVLDHLPGKKTIYLRWQELEKGVSELVAGANQLAMEYSPRNANPYISRVDAGTIELVQSQGVRIVPSGDLIQLFEATLSDEQIQLHLQASEHNDAAFARAWKFIADRIRKEESVDEVTVRQEIMDHFAEHNMVTYHPPIVALGSHAGNPHYETGTGEKTLIGEGDFVLIDSWAKLDVPGGIYSDLTKVGFVGESVPEQYENIFPIVAQARDAAISVVREGMKSERPVQGWEVGQAARDVIDKAGYGDSFIHRTGHSIGQETHGNGANMDNLESKEDRRLMRRTCFSIEPGIYLPEFGIRSEVNVLIEADGNVRVTGGEPQTRVLPILSDY